MKLSDAIKAIDKDLRQHCQELSSDWKYIALDVRSVETVLLAAKQLLKEHGEDYMDRPNLPIYDELAVCDAVMRGLEKNHELIGLLHKIADH